MLVLYGPPVAGKDTALMLGRSWVTRAASSRCFSEGLNIVANSEGQKRRNVFDERKLRT
jgi:hypothetical protein